MDNNTLKIGIILAMLTVIIGAFGAHGLKDTLVEYGTQETFDTAVQYHGMHALALIFVGVLGLNNESKWLNWAKWLFVVGIVFFSGSLYVLSVSGIKILGVITPIGGLCFIAGWSMMIASLKSK
ncbi:DUF423 domain-containing protein [Reichenbachiella agarivorans]|uniref:DUF423 domain-containing protein n=1 Tax=Reichenbachiella agarivorans TaxID=2979464 RepID=A0ABY6CKS5_9BACT|nr:DUF423 domain-containing protein [Reichenbachiella agarivorans]UXP31121.1 DUF423 domain-containing protein [Reichenbachiella agarivorans]